jgi:glycerol-3-phosphate dehydrogenase
MGYRSRSVQLTRTLDITLGAKEVAKYTKQFQNFDKDGKGFITTVDVQRVLQNISVQIDENARQGILDEMDLNKNGQVNLNDFLQLVSAVKKSQVSDSRLAILMKTAEESLDLRGPVSVEEGCDVNRKQQEYKLYFYPNLIWMSMSTLDVLLQS